MKRHALVVVIFLLLVGIVSAADLETTINCSNDVDCITADLGESSYCSLTKGVCYLKTETNTTATNYSNTTTTTSTDTVDTSALKKQVSDLETTVGSINTKTTGLESDVLVVKNDVKNLKTQVSGIQQQLTKLDTQLSKGLGDIESSLSTGLATLKGDLDTTKTEITSLEEDLDKSNTTRNVFLIVILLVVGGGVAFFLLRKPKHKIDPEVKDYISGHIKQGASYDEIKHVLLQSGWPETDIAEAYKNTVRHNYEQYKKSNKKLLRKGSPKPATKKQPAQKISPTKFAGPDKKKIIVIAVIGIVFLLGAFFLLKAATGQAINFQTNFAHDAPLKCTPPHIVSEGGCCLDSNQNNVCDKIEAENAKKAKVDAAICTTDAECTIGKTCIDNSCAVLKGKFKTDCAGEFKCNLNNIKIRSSDGELYTVYAKKGSYAAAGAIDWTIQEIPNYCQGEVIQIPIEIVKKDLACYHANGEKISCNQDTTLSCSKDADCLDCISNFGSACTCDQSKKRCKLKAVDKIKSEILNKETIILGIGETSKKISHPNAKVDAKLKGFTLKVIDANEFCFPGN
tara:strand:+ start:39396 stop:41102 length:1707 start_codon:yes stop_codon:yes gene_type:complete